MSDDIYKAKARQAALDYHEFPQPGKLEIRATKPMGNQLDLALAYSPGVAEACVEIKNNPQDAARFTARSNLVGVITNGTAVLGLGNIGALASKPVMEGKAVLFKKFAHINCFDIEINEPDPQKLAESIVRLEPTFGAINLEDIKAPDCFIVEDYCRKHMNIPVFHDDQHGTAIVVAAAALNAIALAGKKPKAIKIASVGAGAAGIACLNMLLKLGIQRKNIWLCDSGGLITKKRDPQNSQKAAFAQDSDLTTLDQIIDSADMFLGLSGPAILTPAMVKKMAKRPIIFALANPTPEIMPEAAKKVAPDAIIATGRSDYPNQVNNVLCFPFIFRGALDVGATTINEEMQVACIHAIAALAREATDAVAAEAYNDEDLTYGPNYLIPKAFDPRLLCVVAGAVAQAAMESGVAKAPLDIEEYKNSLEAMTNKSAMLMRPVFEAARRSVRRIVFAEGEDRRVLRSAYTMLEETCDIPILVGRPKVIEERCQKLGLPMDVTARFEIVNPEKDARYFDYWNSYYEIMKRRGVTPDTARAIIRTNTTAISAVMVHRGEADSMICGTYGQYHWHLKYVRQILAKQGLSPIGALSLNIMESGPIFVGDTQLNMQPTPEQVVGCVIAAARHARRFGVEPVVALCASSQFGNLNTQTGGVLRQAVQMLDAMDLDFSYEGEMNVDTALDGALRRRLFPAARIKGTANVLIFGSGDAALAVSNVLRKAAQGLEVGPILMGMGNRAHILTPDARSRDLLNAAALAGNDVACYA